MVVVVREDEVAVWRMRVLVKRASLWGFVLGGAERLGVGVLFAMIELIVGSDVFEAGVVFLSVC